MKEEINLKYKPINKKPKYKQVTVLHEYIVTIEDKITVPADANVDDAYIKWGNISLFEDQANDDSGETEQECVGSLESNFHHEIDFKRPATVLVHDEENVLVSYGRDAEENKKFWQSMLDNRKNRKGENNA